MAEVREALALGPEIPVVYTDARERQAVKKALIELTQHALRRARAA
jgi:hypothetical protein